MSASSIDSRALVEALTDFSSRAAHDLTGPINQAGSLVALFVQKYKGKLDPDADVLLEFLQSSAARMRGVTAGVQEYMDVISGRPEITTVDLNHALALSLARLEAAIQDSGTAITSDNLATIRGDAKQIGRIFDIVLGNAIKFRRPDAPSRIHVSSAEAEGRYTLRIEDSGLGVDPKYYEAIFLPFRKVHGKELQGAGLGLAIVRMIAALHGGSVRAEPAANAGKGTAIVLDFPAE